MRDIKKRLENTCGSENEKFEKSKNSKFLPSENFEKERIGEQNLCWRTKPFGIVDEHLPENDSYWIYF